MLGQTFGRLTVVAVSPQNSKKFLCRCACGNEKAIRADHLRTGATTSCGCLAKEMARQRASDGVPHKNMDGHSKTREYSIWMNIRQRCNNPKNPHYKYYGARGIAVCARWGAFSQFLADMGAAPPDTSIDRIDNERGYEPDNCRWASRTVQQNNQRINRRITYGGETLTISEWAAKTGIPRNTLDARVLRGLPLEAVFSKKRRFPALKTHCKRGHALTPDNLYVYGKYRICKRCRRER